MEREPDLVNRKASLGRRDSSSKGLNSSCDQNHWKVPRLPSWILFQDTIDEQKITKDRDLGHKYSLREYCSVVPSYSSEQCFVPFQYRGPIVALSPSVSILVSQLLLSEGDQDPRSQIDWDIQRKFCRFHGYSLLFSYPQSALLDRRSRQDSSWIRLEISVRPR